MRLVKIPLLVLLLTLTIAELVSAQSDLCDSLSISDRESVRIVSFKGKPGATVMMPLRIDNDSLITGFAMQIIFNPKKLTPVKNVIVVCDSVDTLTGDCIRTYTDSNGIKWQLPDGGRMTFTDTLYDEFNNPYDTVITNFLVNYYTDPEGNVLDSVLNLNFLPALDTIKYKIKAGSDVIAYILFKASDTLKHGSTSPLRIYARNEYTYDRSVFPVESTFVGCRRPNFGESWYATDLEQTNSINVYPAIPNTVMRFVCDTTATTELPVVNSFYASPSSVSASGGLVRVHWSVSTTDSVRITRSPDTSPTFSMKSTSAEDSSATTSVTAQTVFTLVAYRGTNTVTRTTTVTVGGTTNANPVVTSSVLIDSVNEGQTISFTVSATDSDPLNGSITLAASNLPTGASFPSQVNVGTVSGSFNWTPNVGQKGTYQIVFTGSDQSGGVGTRTVTIIVLALEYDRLFSTSAPPPDGQPVGGLRGTNEIFFPVNLVSSKTVYGIQYDMTYPYRIVQIDSIELSGRIPDYSVYDNIGVTPGSIRVVTFGLSNEPVKTDTTTAVMWLVCTLDSSAVPWTSATMKLANGRESIDPDPNKPSYALVTDSGIIEIDNPGDVNLDKIIDVGDVVNIVAYVIGNYPLSRRQFATADIIRNDSVNVFDLVGDINLIYGVSPSPSPAPAENAIVGLSYEDLSAGQSEDMTVKSELPTSVAGVQLEVAYDPNSVTLGRPTVTDDYRNFSLQYKNTGNGRMRILLYHGAGALATPSDLIQQGTAQLVNIPITAKTSVAAGNKSQIRITQALLATPTAASLSVEGVDPTLPYSFNLRQNYPNPFNPTTTIEFSLGASSSGATVRDVSLEIYNVLGQQVKTLVNTKLEAGSHRIVWDATNKSGQRVASGIYLYRLRVDSECQTRKMVFLK